MLFPTSPELRPRSKLVGRRNPGEGEHRVSESRHDIEAVTVYSLGIRWQTDRHYRPIENPQAIQYYVGAPSRGC